MHFVHTFRKRLKSCRLSFGDIVGSLKLRKKILSS